MGSLQGKNFLWLMEKKSDLKPDNDWMHHGCWLYSREGWVLAESRPGDKTDLNLSATCVSLKWALSQTSGHSPAQPTPDFGCIIPGAKSLGELAQTSVSTKPQD